MRSTSLLGASATETPPATASGRIDVERTMTMPPGPRGLATLGFFGGGSAAGVLAFLARTARRYGPVAGFRFLHTRVYIVDEPSLIEEILVRRQHLFARDTGAALLRELVGDGLLTSDEPRHRVRRRMLQPAFHRAQIEAYAATMVAQTAQLADEWVGRDRIDIGTEMRRLTLGIVGAALFGADLRSNAEVVAAILKRVTSKAARIAPLFALGEPLVTAMRRRFPAAPSFVFNSERRELKALIEPLIEQRRSAGGDDLISLLLAQRDDGNASLDNDDVQNEVVTLVLAGHETTATALTWALYLVATHPAVAARLRTELATVLADRDPTLADVANLPYTAAVFAEALRLYPPAPAFGRRPIGDLTLGGYTIRSGSSIFVSPYVTQRNARWFADPESFAPERWSGPAPPKFAYFPFGGGANMCIGEPFSKLEGVLVLATLGRRFHLALIDQLNVGIMPGATLRPDRAIVMRPESRLPARPPDPLTLTP